MKALRIIPLFIILIVCTYLGMLFVEANRQEVVISFGKYQSPATALGFVVLTCILLGMCVAGALCSIELFGLYVQFKRLKRRVQPREDEASVTPTPMDA